jgi:hypothetical protein
MAETVYTRVLRQAVEIEGSTQALATRLRVPETTLARWIAGRASMPYVAFLEALRYVTANEHALKDDPASGETTLTLKIGPNFARCSACDGVEFRSVNPTEPLRYVSKVACKTCGSEVPYGQLVVGLAKEVTLHSRAAHVRLKRTQAELRADDPRKKT